MRHNVDTQKFKLFSFITDKDIYAAIPKEFLSILDQNRSEFGSLQNVPVDKTIRGVLLQYSGDDNFNMDENTPQIDITINQLQETDV